MERFTVRIICVNTGDKFGHWYVKNLKHMIDTYSGLKYDEFVVITSENHKGVFNKLQMFDMYRDGENLYFDLDICIYGKVPNLIRKDVTVLKIWWHKIFHTSFNSSIISWTGDHSYIYKTFMKDPKMYEEKYNKGLDEMIEKEKLVVNNYGKVCYSLQGTGTEYLPKNPNYSIVLFNQKHHLMEPGWTGWWTNYFLPKSE